MKIMFASGIHGSTCYCRKMLDMHSESGAGWLVTLGDLLYHGSRNDPPREYAPKEMIAMLNPLKNQIYVIRGNYDTKMDQMVLEFPILVGYGLLVLEGEAFYATHGHVYNQDRPPPLQDRDILIHGHTHILKAKIIEAEGDRYITMLGPGSVSIPKGGNPNTYAVLENGVSSIRTLEGEVVKELRL